MQNRKRFMKGRYPHRLVAMVMVVVMGLGTALSSAQAADDKITLGWTSWADARFMIALVKQQIEEHTSVKVNDQKLRIDVQYQAVANGDIDGMVMAWLPDTHDRYWQKVHDRVTNLGPMYTGAQVGLAVPDYVSESMMDSISDLGDHRVADKLNGEIEGIDPGAGEMRQAGKALKQYHLDGKYTLKEGSDESMTKALAHSVKEMEPVVATLWTPHWAFAKWDMRFLKDPKKVFGGKQHVDVVVHKGFRDEHPEVAKFLRNLHIPLDKLQEAMQDAQATDEKTAVKRFVEDNPDLVKSWWIGTGAEVSGAGADSEM